MKKYKDCLDFLAVLENGRKKMIEDFKNDNPDLYMELYQKLGSQLFELYQQKYMIQWLQSQWKDLIEYMKKPQSKKTIAHFAEWYGAFLQEEKRSTWEYMVFDEELQALQVLISSNDRWEENVHRVETLLEKNRKIYQDKIQEIRSGIK